jgi:excisionase family DNA binding protein
MAKAKAAAASAGTPEPLLSIQGTALELNCSEKTVRRLIARGELKAIRIGRLVRVSRGQLEIYKTMGSM